MKVRIKLTTKMTIVHCRRPLTILSIEARYHCASNHNIQALAGHVTNYILTGIPHLSHRHTHIESELRCTHKLYVSISIFRYFRQTTLLLAAHLLHSAFISISNSDLPPTSFQFQTLFFFLLLFNSLS